MLVYVHGDYTSRELLRQGGIQYRLQCALPASDLAHNPHTSQNAECFSLKAFEV